MRLLKLLALMLGSAMAAPLLAQTAQTVTLTVSPASGAGSVTPVATWSSTGASSCTASGGWSGSKATSGTLTLPPITASATYSLTCSSNTGTATVAWVAPTQRTDDAPLTNLAGHKVYRWTGSAAPALVATVAMPALTTVLNSVPGGPSVFAVSAYDSADIESALSAPVAFTVAGQSATVSRTVTVTTAPKPPTNPIVTQPTAYQVVIKRNLFAFVPVGTVPLRTACIATETIKGYTVVPRWAVKWSGANQPLAVVAKCA